MYTFTYLRLTTYVSRLLNIIGLFCRISFLLEGSCAKETYDVFTSTNICTHIGQHNTTVCVKRWLTYIYVYTYVYIYIYVYVCMYQSHSAWRWRDSDVSDVYIHTYMYLHIYVVRMWPIDLYIYACVYIYKYIHMSIYLCRSSTLVTLVRITSPCMSCNIYIHVCIVWEWRDSLINTYIYVSAYTHIHICLYIYVCCHTHTHKHTRNPVPAFNKTHLP